MKLEEYRSRAFAYALEQGCDAAETYYVSGDSLSMNAQDGEIDRYEVSRQAGLSLRVQYEGSDGYAYTEALDDPEQLVRRAMDNAKIIETTDEHPMQGRCTYETVTPAPNPFEGLSEEEMIHKTLQLEKAALTADPSVKRTAVCEVGRGTGHIELHNTRGLAAVRDVSEGYCAVETILGKNGTLKTGYAVRVGAEAAKLGACAKAAVREGLEKFGASTVPSGEYRILLKNTAASDLLRAFMPVFSADEAQKGCSLLAGREGQTVGSEKISIARRHRPHGVLCRAGQVPVQRARQAAEERTRYHLARGPARGAAPRLRRFFAESGGLSRRGRQDRAPRFRDHGRGEFPHASAGYAGRRQRSQVSLCGRGLCRKPEPAAASARRCGRLSRICAATRTNARFFGKIRRFSLTWPQACGILFKVPPKGLIFDM